MSRSEKIRILHITFNMAIGGTEQVIKQLVENTNKEQFEVSVCCIDGEMGALGQALVEQGIPIINFERSPKGLDFSVVSQLRAYVKEQEISLVHCHQYTPYVYGLLAVLGTRVKVIFTEHGRFYPDRFHWKRLILNPLLSLFTDNITAISSATAQAMSRYENFPKRKIQVIYNGIRHKVDKNVEGFGKEIRKELQIPECATVFGTISRLQPIKNQKMMVAAFAQSLKQNANLFLLIVGDGPERKALEAQVSQLNVGKNVIFTGFKVDPKPYFSAIDIFLLSSLSEGTSMTLLEAMANSKAAIVTRVGGNPEIVEHNTTGFITQSDDANEFSNAISTLANDLDKAKRFGEAGKRRFNEQFSIEKMIQQYESSYRKLTQS